MSKITISKNKSLIIILYPRNSQTFKYRRQRRSYHGMISRSKRSSIVITNNNFQVPSQVTLHYIVILYYIEHILTLFW